MFSAVAVTALFVASCAETSENAAEEQPADTAAMAAPAASLADYAGTWNMRSAPESGADTTSTIYQLQVSGDQWTILLPDRDPIVATTMVSGDSIIVDAGPYESVRRKGLMVTTHGVFRVSGDQLTGTTVAHYQTTGTDSVLTLRTTGTRAN